MSTTSFPISYLALLLLAIFTGNIHCGKTHSVHSTDQLVTALKSVAPGDTIQLADGHYHGLFTSNVKGSEDKPITMTGSRQAILSSVAYGLHLDGASHWVLKGFTIEKSKKGLVLDHSTHVTIDSVEVRQIDEEGVHFRKDSSDNVLQHSYIHHTGVKTPGFGEGVYIGSAIKNWVNNKPDHSDRNKVLNNRIGPNVAAEEIDIKEGSCCGTISGNHFDGTGMSGQHFADSWVDVKGDKYVIENNTGEHSLSHGIQVHHIATALEGLKADGHGLLSGCGNHIRHQKCSGIHGKCVEVNVKTTIVKANDCHNEVVE